MLNDVFPPKDGPLVGRGHSWRHAGKIRSKTPQKWAWIGSFKPKRQNLYIAISPELRQTSDLRTEFGPRKALCGWSARSFFSRSRAQLELLHRFLCWMAQTTYFRPRTVLLGVTTMGDVIWRTCAPKVLQRAWIGSFKPKWRNLFNQYLQNY